MDRFLLWSAKNPRLGFNPKLDPTKLTPTHDYVDSFAGFDPAHVCSQIPGFPDLRPVVVGDVLYSYNESIYYQVEPGGFATWEGDHWARGGDN